MKTHLIAALLIAGVPVIAQDTKSVQEEVTATVKAIHIPSGIEKNRFFLAGSYPDCGSDCIMQLSCI